MALKINKVKLIDVVDRTAATFAETFLGLLVADSTGVTQLSAVKIAAVASGLAAAKYLFVQLSAYLGSSPTPPAA